MFDIAVTLSYKYGSIFNVTFAVSEDCISFTNFISFGKTEIIIHKITLATTAPFNTPNENPNTLFTHPRCIACNVLWIKLPNITTIT